MKYPNEQIAKKIKEANKLNNEIYKLLSMELGSDTTRANNAHQNKKKRQTYSKKKTLEAQENMQTQGKKGIKLPRINLALTPSNYDYVKTMASMNGVSVTKFINNLIKNELNSGANSDVYKEVLEIRNSI